MPVGPASKTPAAAPKHEVLGAIDIGAGLIDGAWDAPQSGIPDANTEPVSWVRRTALDMATPKARPGYVQRWVRIKTADGAPDTANKAEAVMNGWRPRRAESLAEFETGMPVYDPGDGKGGVLVFKDELLLCEMPLAQFDALRRQLDAEQDRINRAIYQQTRSGQDLPEKYATLDYDSRESSDLIDN
jgi:hypothetical protein